MNLNQLAKEITKREGLKKQVNIAQVKEILHVIVDMEVEESSFKETFSYCSPRGPSYIIHEAAGKEHKPKKKTKKAKRK